MKFAVIETGGKQYQVNAGEKIRIEKIDAKAGDTLSFDKVLLMVDGENVIVGKPYVVGAKVEGTVEMQGRAKKVIVFKYHSKTRYRKKKGHRQPFTEVTIRNIQ